MSERLLIALYLVSSRVGKNLERLAMKRIFAIVGVLFVVGASFVGGQQQANRPSQERYTPTKGEWLAVDLNATFRSDNLIQTGLSISYGYDVFEDTVVIHVTYVPSKIDRAIMNKHIDAARNAVKSVAKLHGWDSWVKVKEDLNSWDF